MNQRLLGAFVLFSLAFSGVAGSIWSFVQWLQAGVFRFIIPAWPLVAIAGFTTSLLVASLAFASLNREQLRLWPAIHALFAAIALLGTAILALPFDSPALIDLVLAPVVFPLAWFAGGYTNEAWRIPTAILGAVYLIGAFLIVWPSHED